MKQFITNLVLLFGGAMVGLVLALIAAPSSGWAALVGFAVLPLSFFAGLAAWWGIALLNLGGHLVKKVIAREAASPNDSILKSSTPPGSFMFLPTSMIVCLIGGGIISLISWSSWGLIALCGYPTLGLIYGAVAWIGARRGYIAIDYWLHIALDEWAGE